MEDYRQCPSGCSEQGSEGEDTEENWTHRDSSGREKQQIRASLERTAGLRVESIFWVKGSIWGASDFRLKQRGAPNFTSSRNMEGAGLRCAAVSVLPCRTLCHHPEAARATLTADQCYRRQRAPTQPRLRQTTGLAFCFQSQLFRHFLELSSSD